MNGERGPEAELLLREVERPTDGRKEEQRDRIQDEHGAHGNGDFFVAGLHDGSHGGDGAAAADGGAGGDQKCGGFFYFKKPAEQQADEQGKGDATGGVKETTATGVEHFVQIHSKTERDDRGFQQEFSEFSAVGGVRVSDG